MDRIAFIESISGINYPEMLVHFFDQFIALKKLVEEGYIEKHGERKSAFYVKVCSDDIF